MIDDFTPQHKPLPQRSTPKILEPLEKTPQTSIHELAAAHEAAQVSQPATEPVADEPAFTPPEAIAAAEAPAREAPVAPHHKASDASPKRPWYKLRMPRTKKQKIIAAAVVAVVLLGGGGTTWALTHGDATPPKTVHKAAAKKAVPPKIIYSTLTGLPITDASLNKKPVTGVMIENSIDARPQSGLGAAGVVFEAVAEGGVTRFLGLFQDSTPNNVGPIRSARPYYVQWAMGFDAAYAHVGGSPDALADITAWGTKDMNQFSNGGSYHRITTRDAPHNVYTGIDTLNDLEAKKGYTSTYTGFTRKKEAPSKAPTASTISMSLSGYTYDPSFAYIAATNSYNRSEAGEAQIDANTNTQLSPKVVIAMVTPLARGALDSSGAYYSDYTVTGSGTAYVFQDGVMTPGQWTKASTSGALTFTDSTGAPLALNPGQTWITAITSTAGVTYK
jgi:hypothetical protein